MIVASFETQSGKLTKLKRLDIEMRELSNV